MGGNRTLRGGGSITAQEDFGAEMMSGVQKMHHSDELSLGPTAVIREFVAHGDINSSKAVMDMLREQRKLLSKIDFQKVSDASYSSFMDAYHRLFKITRDIGLKGDNMVATMGFINLDADKPNRTRVSKLNQGKTP